MDIIAEVALLLALCLGGELLSTLLPFPFPSSVAALLLLLALLLAKTIKPRHLQRVSDFFTPRMGLFFVPAAVSIMDNFDLLRPTLFPFLFIAAITTPFVYGVTAWSVQLFMRLEKKRREGKDHG